MGGAQGYVGGDASHYEADAGSEYDSAAGTLRDCGDEGRLEHVVWAGAAREM